MSTDTPIDAIDYYAIWKIWDALRSCALTNTWCEYGNGTPQQRNGHLKRRRPWLSSASRD